MGCRSTLVVAIENGDASLVAALLEAGATVDKLVPGNTTALMVAAATGHYATVQAMLGDGANHTLKNLRGHTAPFPAMTEGHQQIATPLQAHDASSRR